VEAFKQQLETSIKNKPGAYQSQYQQQLEDLYASITGREKFSYDAEGDALYQQYKDQYQQLGRTAMMDTMGQAAALTGGYSSTYGQAVGQQMYDAYLRNLTDKIPELSQQAYSRYLQEGDDLMNQYTMLLDKENTGYNRYRDQLSDWSDDVARQYQIYADARDTERDELADSRKYAYDTAMGMIGAGLMPSEQMLADAGLDKADAQALVNAYLAQMTPTYSGGSSGGSGRNYSGGSGTTATTQGNKVQGTKSTKSQSGNLSAVRSSLSTAGYYNYIGTGGNASYNDWAAGKIDKANLTDTEKIKLIKEFGIT